MSTTNERLDALERFAREVASHLDSSCGVVIEAPASPSAAPLTTVAPEMAPRPQDGKKCGACDNGRHADCSGWCFCPEGPCDREKYGAATLPRARCGHVAYRGHADMCIQDGCQDAAYQVVAPTGPSPVRPGAVALGNARLWFDGATHWAQVDGGPVVEVPAASPPASARERLTNPVEDALDAIQKFSFLPQANWNDLIALVRGRDARWRDQLRANEEAHARALRESEERANTNGADAGRLWCELGETKRERDALKGKLEEAEDRYGDDIATVRVRAEDAEAHEREFRAVSLDMEQRWKTAEARAKRLTKEMKRLRGLLEAGAKLLAGRPPAIRASAYSVAWDQSADAFCEDTDVHAALAPEAKGMAETEEGGRG